MNIAHLAKQCVITLVSVIITVFIAVIGVVVYFETQLPDVNLLKDPQLQVPMKIFSSDGKLIGVFGSERRTPIPIQKVPKQLINAILATEDQRFYEHPGVDPMGLLRAAVVFATTHTASQGGSTITMQVARNYLLTSQKTLGRKFNEILLAIKIDSEFSKEQILELYLNKIYFGNHAYGIAAAAQVYYGKNLNQLSLPELAMLAGIPKAPSSINPIINPTAARARRDHVLARMYEHGYIDKETYEMAISTPVATTYHGQPIEVNAPYVAQMVADAMLAHYGETAATEGLKIYTTIDSRTQIEANVSLRDSLIRYDQRHGYRGPSGNLGRLTNPDTINFWIQTIAKIPTINGLQPAVVTHVQGQSAEAVLGNSQKILIPWGGMKWARKEIHNDSLGPLPTEASNIVKTGDVIRVIKMMDGTWRLAQVPKVEGSLVALNPQNGAILALVGGFDYNTSNFNRATQASRQPGSSFKPFIYAAALDHGYSLSSVINDAPFVMYDASLGGLWRPQNDDHVFHGPTRLRVAIAKSMNLVAIRLLQAIGINYAVNYASRFGFETSQLPHSLSMALGTAVVTPLQMAGGYAIFANGGYKVNPYVIDHITNDYDKLIYQAEPKYACVSCIELNNALDDNKATAEISSVEEAPRVISPQTAYLMTSALHDVVSTWYGTGHDAMVLGRQDLAGKTGTSQSQNDAWFIGYNSDIVAASWVGFDTQMSLGEYGAEAALPMWIQFMHLALQNKPEHTLQQPPGIITALIDPNTGLRAQDGQPNTISELFRTDNTPAQQAAGANTPAMSGDTNNTNTSASTSPSNSNLQRIPPPLF
jgi:penicillin-binding protein 1A